MNKIYITFKARKLKSKLIMQVHDELIIEAVPEELDIVKDIMKDSMENVIKLKVPLDIDLNVGKSWYDTK
ncbi:DNA polymerase I [compost metagenome]